MKSQLRDLADLIQQTAMEHPVYGQASSAVLNLVDHLSAMARCEEANRELNERADMTALILYFQNHPDVEFKFQFDPTGITVLSDRRYWQVRFPAGTIKNMPSKCGYACETPRQLLECLVKELP